MTDLIAALDDPELFAPLFPRVTWGAWRAFMGALFGLPLDDEAAALYRYHTGRATLPDRPFREAALIIGRRGGKSRALALIAVYLACFIDFHPYVAPGEVATIAIIAADRRQARVLLRYVVGTLQAVPMLAALIDGEPLSESVTLTTGIAIEIHTGSIASPRGRSFAAILADEIAFWPTSDGAANPDTEVLAAVRPGLASIPASLLLMASSPYARRGALWQAYRVHFGNDASRVLVWRGTTAEMNPTLDPAIIADAYEADPESAAAEYGAEFRRDIAAFVPREVVDAVVVPRRYELPYVSGTHYYAFTDPSGGSSDAFTLAIGHRDPSGTIVVDCVRERRPPFSPEAVTEEFAAVLKSYRLHSVTGDRYGGEWPREQFRKHRVDYVTSDRSKSEIYVDALPILNSGKIELLDVPRLVSQIAGLERRTARSGRDSVDHAPGSHDDIANSVLGAAVLASARASVPIILSGDALVRLQAIKPRDRFAGLAAPGRNRFATAR